MTELERAVLPYLGHVHVERTKACTCPEDSWAPCGGQYAGRYDVACPHHRRLGPWGSSHDPSGCPNQDDRAQPLTVEGN
jgi:hypothetical protein